MKILYSFSKPYIAKKKEAKATLSKVSFKNKAMCLTLSEDWMGVGWEGVWRE